MIGLSQMPHHLRLANASEISLISDLRLSSLLSLEMPRHSLQAVNAIIAAFPEIDATLVEHGRYTVAESNGDLIGGGGWSELPARPRMAQLVHENGAAAFVSFDAGSVLLRGFFLDPDLGRRGVGAALIRQIEVEAAEAGYCAAETIVPADAQLLYRSLGFKPTRRLALAIRPGEILPLLQMRKSFAPCMAAAA